MKRFVLLLVLIVMAGCGQQTDVPGSLTMTEAELEQWEISLVEMRIEKNEQFMDRSQTPIPAARLDAFEGLNYYFPDKNLVFKTPLVTVAGTDTIYLDKRDGTPAPFLRMGTVSFRNLDAIHTLEVFGPVQPGAEEPLWLPFYDATSGEQTYGGGRYLDLELADDGNVIVDFNRAYNPLCDYDPERFNCTLPPAGNRLAFAVEVGEKTFGLSH